MLFTMPSFPNTKDAGVWHNHVIFLFYTKAHEKLNMNAKLSDSVLMLGRLKMSLSI